MTLSIFWINVFYISCACVSVCAAVLVMWTRVPTGTSGTVGLTMISLVMAGICTDWLDSNLPWIGVKRSLILWAGVLFVIYWLLQKPWQMRERRWNRSLHKRQDDIPPPEPEIPWPRHPHRGGMPPIEEERRN